LVFRPIAGLPRSSAIAGSTDSAATRTAKAAVRRGGLAGCPADGGWEKTWLDASRDAASFRGWHQMASERPGVGTAGQPIEPAKVQSFQQAEPLLIADISLISHQFLVTLP
jgi:hypothetical protein